MDSMIDLIHADNQLVLTLKPTPCEMRKLDELFESYHDLLWDAMLNLSVKYLINGPVKSAYRKALNYLQHSVPYPTDGAYGKLFKSVAFRASVTYIEFAKKIKSASRKYPVRCPCDLYKKAIYYCDVAKTIKPDEFGNDPKFQYMVFSVQEPSKTQVRLPFRCCLKSRKVTPFDGYAWKCPDLNADYLVRHAETLPSDVEPGAAFLCRLSTNNNNNSCRYEFRLAFREESKGNGGIDLRRSYLGTVKLIKLQSIKNKRKGW